MTAITRKPNFNNILKILKREIPDRPTPFEFIIDVNTLRKHSTIFSDAPDGSLEFFRMIIDGSMQLGYDYAAIPAWHTDNLNFVKGNVEEKESKSQNEGAVISDRASFENYEWPDPDKGDYSIYEQLSDYLPDGMKLLGLSNGGVLENATELVGYESLCYMSMLDPELTRDIFNAVGSRLLRYYEIISKFDSVGFLMGNDDWGFKTQTMFPTDFLRENVVPWHKKIVEAVHSQGKPIVMHSCGNLREVMDDIIDDIGYDGKHSFEDIIYPVEEAYKLWGDRIAIMGGIDMDFLCTKTPEEIIERGRALYAQTGGKGFAIGSGNSIAKYVPEENYKALLSVTQQ